MMERRTLLKGLLAASMTTALPGALRARPPTQLNALLLAMGDPGIAKILRIYEAENADITFKDEQLPFGQIFSTIEVRLQARNELPDVFIVDGPLTASYTARGHLAPLDDIVKDAAGRYTAPALAQGVVNDHLMSLPLENSTVVMLANLDLFEKAGVTPPSDDPAKRWSWDEVRQAGKAIARPDEGIWGFGFHYSDSPYMILPMPQSLGAVAISKDGVTATGYVDSAPFVEAISVYGKLFTDRIAPAGVYNYNIALEMFVTGKVGMFIGVMSDVTAAANRKDLKWSTAPMPYFPKGRPVTPTGSWHLGINPRTRNREAASMFVKALSTSKYVEAYFSLRQNPPVLEESWTTLQAQLSTPGWKIARHEILNTAVPRPVMPGWLEYDSILRLALREIQGGADVGPRLHTAALQMDRELKKYR